MKQQRFFVEPKIGEAADVVLPDAGLAHQLKNVFRFREGDSVILLDDSGCEFVSEIVMLTKDEAKFHILSKRQNVSVPKREVWLYQSLIKKDNFEWILEKCTELGVAHFVPVLSERSEKKGLNVERAAKILKEASEQSGRGRLPELHEMMSLEDAVAGAKAAGLELVAFHTNSNGTEKESVADFLKKTKSNQYAIFIGPEGGWTDKEIAFFKAGGVSVLSLGTQILRAETAAVAVSTLFLLS